MRERCRLGKPSAERETRGIEHPLAYQMQQDTSRPQLHPSYFKAWTPGLSILLVCVLSAQSCLRSLKHFAHSIAFAY